ncbi:MAG: uncharacterized protein KVP18_004785 [Porospora cf. gigantea A]|uniref:uncharacterized protein n=1 Tax=Porospora cf. gigantea A TaxID=2853593 RepID=UPI00355ACCA6|nr:MAG: hypothetical protein KVP18_004785 [Porospora cf. gigantea A]
MKLLLGLLPVVFAHSCQQENIAILGVPLEVVEVADVNECVNVCSRNDHCKAITFKAGMCRVMADETTATETGSVSALRSCPRNLQHVDSFDPCLRLDTVLNGNVVGGTRTVDVGGCAEACRRSPYCEAFSWHSKACRLVRGPIEAESRRGVVSGSMECVVAPADEAKVECSDRDRILSGSAIRRLRCSDAHCCQEACMLESRCFAFNYDRLGERCSLLSNVHGLRSRGGWISGFKHCFNDQDTDSSAPPQLHHSCLSWTELSGREFAYKHADSAETCMVFCEDQKTCDGFSWNWNSQSCLLKSELTGSQSSLDYVSAVKGCFQPTTTTTFTTASTVEVTSTSNTLENHITSRTNTPKVTSITSVITSVITTTDTPAITTSWRTGSTPTHSTSTTGRDPMTNKCFIWEVDFRGFDVAVTRTGVLLDCVRSCADMYECKHFSFDTVHGICYLKSSDQGGVLDGDFVSGSMGCFAHDEQPTVTPSPSGAGCYLRHTKFVGPTLATRRARNVEECLRVCQGHFRCEFFSFSRELALCYLKRHRGELRRSEGFVSGDVACLRQKDTHLVFHPKPAYPVEDTHNPCYWLQTDFEGLSQNIAYAPSTATCLELCKHFPGCKHFTWNRQTQQCYMKSQVDGLLRDHRVVAGTMSCFYPKEYPIEYA